MTKRPAAKPATERRAHPRYPKKVEVLGTPQQGGTEAKMVTSDLSVGGLHCVSTADFPEMTLLAVRLMLPLNGGTNAANQSLDVEAVVVRREEFRSPNGESRFELALFFTRVEDMDKQRIAQFLGV